MTARESDETWEYKTVPIGNGDQLQLLLDLHATEGWRLAQTYESMGYTVRLIFERVHRA